MKLDIVKTIIAFAMSLLIAYGMYAFDASEHGWLLPSVSFVVMLLFLVSALGLKIEWMRSMVNVKIVSWLFVIIGLVVNIIFSRSNFDIPAFIISNGCISLLFLLLAYSLIKANKNN